MEKILVLMWITTIHRGNRNIYKKKFKLFTPEVETTSTGKHTADKIHL